MTSNLQCASPLERSTKATSLKVLYAGDNRDRANWGCRATSMAFGELIDSVATISGVIQGKEVADYSITRLRTSRGIPSVHSRFPVRIVQRLLNKTFSRISNNGAPPRLDYITEDADESVATFHKLVPFNAHLSHIWDMFRDCDAVIINGEGDYIFSTPPRRTSLFYNFLIRLCAIHDKPVILANAMFSACPGTGDNRKLKALTAELLKSCSQILVRDPMSLTLLEEMHIGDRVTFIPDALFTWTGRIKQWKQHVTGHISLYEPFGAEQYLSTADLDLESPFICLSGSSSAAWNQELAVKAYISLAESLQRLGIPVLVVPTCDGDRFLQGVADQLNLPLLSVRTPIRVGAAILGKASAFVSGRFHPSILASNGGTPCVFLGSNSHKTLSLQSMLEYDRPHEYSSIPESADIARIVNAVAEVLSLGKPLRDRIEKTVNRRSNEALELCEVIHKTLVRAGN